jgi:uracil-DNA glycosylase family 4
MKTSHAASCPSIGFITLILAYPGFPFHCSPNPVTNTVKHFKFEPRGKARLHKRANAAEQTACRPWLAAELARVKPKRIVALGLMAAQTLFGNAFRMHRDRGRWHRLANGVMAMATWHPAGILRLREATSHDRAFNELVADLGHAARAADIDEA